MFWNSRFARICVGIALLATVVIVLLPGFTGYTSVDGTVNARFALVSAPIEGVVSDTPPKVGTALPEGTSVFFINNDRISRTAEAQLDADLGAAKERLQALEIQAKDLSALKADLVTRLKEYQQASIVGIQQEIIIRQQRISTAQANKASAEADLARKQTLGATGVVAGSSVEQARAASVSATSEQNIAKAELERLQRQLDALKRGTFVGEGRNDVPYSQQRTDEVTIQLANVEAQIRTEKARIQQLKGQLHLERARNDRLSLAAVQVPFEGVIWRNNVVAGSNVVVGNELMRLLDCRDLFVDILVDEVDYDEIKPGDRADVRLLGTSDIIGGHVLSVRGSAAAVEEVVLAALPPKSRGKNARIRVALDPSGMQTDYANFCQVGRTVQVRFARTSSLQTFADPVMNWVKSLWFSIS
ncbi:HlyD family secretion protein [Methylobacterium gregans]|uniref:p-hydroxybenzoic acid efflux pump subunit AaeA n=1 Tax=Methylobacterium gregans TaxID=374424 RepID=A0AA37HM13_9HYPH|nr:HlyD family efflux transporter periplasmic adaptor subunit [Methylobacterium gregans]MDQ0523608.1 multidrug resistance efflux pump [Methylobacterium gregans]GJD78259.1 p-hydroxybenzoic acid efflux pump subunit AaeA [Methylobacterium gregans]GLS55522.1 hemolysin D [Methylobacterium gregans]